MMLTYTYLRAVKTNHYRETTRVSSIAQLFIYIYTYYILCMFFVGEVNGGNTIAVSRVVLAKCFLISNRYFLFDLLNAAGKRYLQRG